MQPIYTVAGPLQQSIFFFDHANSHRLMSIYTGKTKKRGTRPHTRASFFLIPLLRTIKIQVFRWICDKGLALLHLLAPMTFSSMTNNRKTGI